jgi:hypothetical protein
MNSIFLAGNQQHGDWYHYVHDKDYTPVELREQIDVFYLRDKEFQDFHMVGKHWCCRSQKYSHYPNVSALTRKDKAGYVIKNYGEWYKTTNRAHCFNEWEFIPEMLILDSRED